MYYVEGGRGELHIFTSAQHERLRAVEQGNTEREDVDAVYHTEVSVGVHSGRGTVVKRVANEGEATPRGTDSMHSVAVRYEDWRDFLRRDEVCDSCRRTWLRRTGLLETREGKRVLGELDEGEEPSDEELEAALDEAVEQLRDEQHGVTLPNGSTIHVSRATREALQEDADGSSAE